MQESWYFFRKKTEKSCVGGTALSPLSGHDKLGLQGGFPCLQYHGMHMLVMRINRERKVFRMVIRCIEKVVCKDIVSLCIFCVLTDK